MSLLDIHIQSLRSVEDAQLQLPPTLALIWGPNGSGKTSILEAMFLLGRGRSFRTRNNARLISRDRSILRVIGNASNGLGGSTTLGVEASPTGTRARISGRDTESLSELAEAFAVQVIEPGIHRLIEEAGHRRRRWLDWAVFHVEPSFLDHWTQYARALKQRNAALRIEGADPSIWDPELSRLGELITEARQNLMTRLTPYWCQTVGALSGLEVDLHYQRGWSQDHSLAEVLAISRSRDQVRQMTHHGPHRGDVSVRIHGRPARDVLSRGQQKLVAAAMTVAQLKLLQATTHLRPTLLLDDPAAELDAAHLARFVEEVAQLRCQLVVTSLHAESRLFGAPDRMFRVEEGRVQPV